MTDRDGIYLDATVGGGGHAAALLATLSDRGRLIGLDRDPVAVQAAGETLEAFGGRAQLRESVFWRIEESLDALGVSAIDGVFFDLGVSSRQIDDPSRGFSYVQDGPLDMRMGPGGRTASDLVNASGFDDLLRIFRDYGEERRSPAIARAICQRRGQQPIRSTADLAKVIRSAIPANQSQKTLARIFQALRIELNEELDHLRNALEQAVIRLKRGARIGVISYHSLEDRAVKGAFAEWVRGCICPPGFPACRCGRVRTLRFLETVGRRGIRPGPDEVASNPRARSATLRISERV